MGWLSEKELIKLGFKRFGSNTLISDKASLYGISFIEIGNNVRIDDYCVLSAGEGGIVIGNNVHIAVYSSIIGGGKVIIGNYCNISSRVSIYSSTDDFSGSYMTNPMVEKIYTNVISKSVTLEKHVIIGSGCVILPGVTLHEGAAIGALSLVKSDIPEYTIFAGQPARFLKKRHKDLLKHEKRLNANE